MNLDELTAADDNAPLTLDELITALDRCDPNLLVPRGFTSPHSYRGHYDQLAFEPAADVTVKHMLGQARDALEATFTGYKGGTYTMLGDTWCWLACYGCEGEEITPVLLRAMLAEATPGQVEQPNTASEPQEPPAAADRWRTGRKVLRTLYIHQGDDETGVFIGAVDTPELAAAICEAMNRPTEQEISERVAAEAAERWPNLDPADDYDQGVRDVLRWLRGDA